MMGLRKWKKGVRKKREKSEIGEKRKMVPRRSVKS